MNEYEALEMFLMNYRSIREENVIRQIDISDDEYMFLIDDGSRVRFDITNYALTYIKPRVDLTEQDLDDIWKKEFARKLKKKLRNSGITQKEFAQQLGVTDRTVYRYLNQLTLPDYITIRKIARILGCTFEELTNFDYLYYEE